MKTIQFDAVGILSFVIILALITAAVSNFIGGEYVTGGCNLVWAFIAFIQFRSIYKDNIFNRVIIEQQEEIEKGKRLIEEQHNTLEEAIELLSKSVEKYKKLKEKFDEDEAARVKELIRKNNILSHCECSTIDQLIAELKCDNLQLQADKRQLENEISDLKFELEKM